MGFTCEPNQGRNRKSQQSPSEEQGSQCPTTPHYINHFTCNPSAWPTDREAEIAAWNDMVGDADDLVVGEGPVKFTGWISNTEGYVLLEADSKAEVIGICAQFWPLFHNDIMEIVPTAQAGRAIIAGATQGWRK